MVVYTWRDAVTAVELRLRRVSDEQQAIAAVAGLEPFGRRTFHLVAAARLRDALVDVIGTGSARAASDGQLDYLEDGLGEFWKASDRPRLDGYEEASAWITVLHARRAVEALKLLSLTPGDVVQVGGDPEGLEIVHSFSEDGRINFQGGGGAKARPHRVSLVARAVDESGPAKAARTAARNRQARRRSRPPDEKIGHLDEYLVRGDPEPAEILLLEECLADAEDERPLQRLLTAHPRLLKCLFRGSLGVYVVPWPRFGGHFVPDFVVAVADSLGVTWTLVELESPTARPHLNDGSASESLRHALGQVADWRDWIRENLYLAQNGGEFGVGLTQIREDAEALILIGRTADAEPRFNRVRKRHAALDRVAIHSYDWLQEIVGGDHHPLKAPLRDLL